MGYAVRPAERFQSGRLGGFLKVSEHQARNAPARVFNLCMKARSRRRVAVAVAMGALLGGVGVKFGAAELGRSLGLCLTGRVIFRGQNRLEREPSAGWLTTREH